MDWIMNLLELVGKNPEFVGMIIALAWVAWLTREYNDLQDRIREVEDRQFSFFALMTQKVIGLTQDEVEQATRNIRRN